MFNNRDPIIADVASLLVKHHSTLFFNIEVEGADLESLMVLLIIPFGPIVYGGFVHVSS